MGRTVVCLPRRRLRPRRRRGRPPSGRPSTTASSPIDRGAAALWQSLKKLGTRASLIMVTAHPDDEDAGMLAYESRGVGARVHLLTLNRGEGGANVMSGDYFDALGLVRTMEMLAAGRWYGVEQHWTRVVDYGFSKTKAESIWPMDARPRPCRRSPRHSTVRPQVITSVFVGGPSDGHGNHETAGAMAQEAFHAAADPKAFPELGRPWAACSRSTHASAAANRMSRFRRATTTRCSPLLTPKSDGKAMASTDRRTADPPSPARRSHHELPPLRFHVSPPPTRNPPSSTASTPPCPPRSRRT